MKNADATASLVRIVITPDPLDVDPLQKLHDTFPNVHAHEPRSTGVARILFMTGTVAPGAETPLLVRAAVEARIADYRRSLAFHLGVLAQGGVDRLVFVENSGHGMAPFEDLVAASGVADRVELMSYAAPPVPPEGSRLAAEFELMRHAGAHARTFREASDEATVWKITGRYLWRNVAATAARAPEGFDAHFHCRNWPRPYVDFAHAGFALGRMDAILAALLEGEMGREYMAWVRGEMESGSLARFRIRRRLSPIPRLSGRRGVDGVAWESPRQRARYALRVAAAAVAPRLWI
jgi:hypothetical protein